MVFLHLQPYKKTTVEFKGNRKLSPRFFESYKVIQWIGQVSYKLELANSKIHSLSCIVLEEEIEKINHPYPGATSYKEGWTITTRVRVYLGYKSG